jgi:hypothetical protein
MSFAEKYKIQDIVAAPRIASPKMSPQERTRHRLLEAIQLQKSIIDGDKAGKPVMVTRNGKSMKPRTFWLQTPAGIAFTPRFGNEFLFEKGRGIILPNMDALSVVLAEFADAVEAGEFDTQLMAILNQRSGRGVKSEDSPLPPEEAGDHEAQPDASPKKRGRSKRS